MMGETAYNISLSIPFATAEHAELAHEVLNVDKELKGSVVSRNFTTSGLNLIVTFVGADLKRLRVAVNSVLKNISLVVKTINQFQNC